MISSLENGTRSASDPYEMCRRPNLGTWKEIPILGLEGDQLLNVE